MKAGADVRRRLFHLDRETKVCDLGRDTSCIISTALQKDICRLHNRGEGISMSA